MNFREFIFNIRSECLRQKLKPLKAIILSSHEEGMKIMTDPAVQEFLSLSTHIGPEIIDHPDGTAWHRLIVYDVEIHWPVNRLAERGGGYRFV